MSAKQTLYDQLRLMAPALVHRAHAVADLLMLRTCHGRNIRSTVNPPTTSLPSAGVSVGHQGGCQQFVATQDPLIPPPLPASMRGRWQQILDSAFGNCRVTVLDFLPADRAALALRQQF